MDSAKYSCRIVSKQRTTMKDTSPLRIILKVTAVNSRLILSYSLTVRNSLTDSLTKQASARRTYRTANLSSFSTLSRGSFPQEAEEQKSDAGSEKNVIVRKLAYQKSLDLDERPRASETLRPRRVCAYCLGISPVTEKASVIRGHSHRRGELSSVPGAICSIDSLAV